jgi:hypothetical protein
MSFSEDMNIDEMDKCLSKLCVSVRKSDGNLYYKKASLHDGDTSGYG